MSSESEQPLSPAEVLKQMKEAKAAQHKELVDLFRSNEDGVSPQSEEDN